MITINHNTTFLISDELGNIPEGKEFGLYHQDTRYLCRFELRLDGQSPLPLAARATDHYTADYFLTNPVLPAVPRGQLSIARRRWVDRGMREDLRITNHGNRRAVFTLEIDVDADFAHIFEVKSSVEVKAPLSRLGEALRTDVRRNGSQICYCCERNDQRRQAVIELTTRPTTIDGSIRFSLSLGPQELWQLGIQVVTATEPRRTRWSIQEWRSHEQQQRRHAQKVLQLPSVKTESETLRHAYEQSVRDFLALQLNGGDIGKGEVAIAAGIPWFMALFGRDSLIAAYQALVFRPNAAKGVLRALARHQGTRIDPRRAEEPGKILHEQRFGPLAGPPASGARYPYYGTIDATPLFLMLLAAVQNVTGDLAFSRELRDHALRALHWLDHYGDRDGDGYVEYLLESDDGLDNQGWKDSKDAIRFRDGPLARPPIALCEVQGYTYAARVGMAGLCDALGEPDRAAMLRRDAAALKERFNRDFWLPDREYFALALDATKRPVDAMTSNPGHLLWTGIAEPEKARRVAERLLSPELFSGWGVRTMATTESGFNPISYHNGSVWPHDNSIIVAGLARYGFVEEAARLADGMLAALSYFPDHRLPELFAGYCRDEAQFPVEYPTTNRPQAWASGAIFLLLTAMAGVDVNRASGWTDPFLPFSVNRLRIEGLWNGRRRATIEIERTSNGEVARRIEGMERVGKRNGIVSLGG